MVLVSALHSSPRRHREAIQRVGLLPNLPHPAQHFGVYVFNDDYNHRTAYKGSFRRTFRVRWSHRPPNDLWRVGYCGPLCGDQFVENGLVLFDQVTEVTLVTSN